MESSRPRARSESAGPRAGSREAKPDVDRAPPILSLAAAMSGARNASSAESSSASKPSRGSDPAKMDDLGPDRQRRHELRALQRLGLRRATPRAGCTCGLPNLPAARWAADREAAQIAQGQSQQPAGPKCRRQRRQQPKRQRRNAAADDDRQRGIVELQRVVGHLVGRREQRHEVGCQSGKHRGLPGLGHQRAQRDQKQAHHQAEADEGLHLRQHRKCRDGGAHSGKDDCPP